MGCFFLCGCDFFGSSTSPTPIPFIPHPAQLNPEVDAFSSLSARSYTWKEGWKIGSRDTSTASRTFTVTKTGGVSPVRVHFNTGDGKALSASIITQMGFNPAKIQLDSTAVSIPDPGAALGFPATPQIGWRLDTITGDLRFVRQLIGMDTVLQKIGTVKTNVECWAFAETTYYGGVAVATARYSMGYNGLVHLYEKRPGFYSSTGDTGAVVLWREITAQ